MSVDILLSRLEKVRPTGPNSWRACCPAHGGKHQNLAIRDNDGVILLKCFSKGCGAAEIAAAVGLDLADLFPPRPTDPQQRGKPIRRPFSARDALLCLDLEITLAYLYAVDLAKGMLLDEKDRARLALCANRIAAAKEATT
jgi:hypothetical protein